MAKFYAVRVGRIPGIYETWNECKEQTNGYSGAQFHSFPTLDQAKEWMGDAKGIEALAKCDGVMDHSDCKTDAYAYVDGSFNPKTLIYGAGVYLNYQGKEWKMSIPGEDESITSMRNVAGEVLGAIKAVEKAIELGIKSITIYYDYQGVKKWADDEWRRNLKGTQDYYEFIKKARNSLDIHFEKVAAHTGVEGNELADALSKQAVGIIA